MLNEFCPNCNGYLLPYQPDGYENRTEGYCPKIECAYASIYDGRFTQALQNYIYNEDYDPVSWGFKFIGETKYWKPEKRVKIEPIEEPEFKPNIINKVNIIPNKDVNEIQKPSHYIIGLTNIIGYEPIKAILRQIINHKGRKRIHGLIVGAAGTSKTVFLKSLEAELIPQGCDFHYIDAATLTKRGLTDYIFNNDGIEILAIDEIDKVDEDHQSVFLNMLESGILQTTSFNNIRRKEVNNMTVIATGNHLKNITEPVRTRFLTMYLRSYEKDEYINVCSRMLVVKYPYIDKELAKYIAIETYENIKPVNMRNADRIGNMIRENPTKIAVKEMIDGLIKYAIPTDILNKLDKQT